MKKLLNMSDKKYNKLSHCGGENKDISCYDCCFKDFYKRPDTYNCVKKLCFYILNYGPSYASEIYYYLKKSKLLEYGLGKKNITILSLGCGFSPDFYALKKYINNYNLDIKYQYIGYDKEKNWRKIRESRNNVHFQVMDLLDGFSLKDYDIIFMCKTFSTIKRNGYEGSFLKLLIPELKKMKSGSYFIFDDINHYKFGRDDFDNAVKNYFSKVRYYYFAINEAYKADNYIAINDTENIFSCPDNLSVKPKPDVTKSVIFEYRK